jgi:hypothetical protein
VGNFSPTIFVENMIIVPTVHITDKLFGDENFEKIFPQISQ